MDPSLPALRQPPCDAVDGLHEDGAEEVAEGEGEKREGCGEGAHSGRRLAVEELQQPNQREHVGHPEYAVLEGQPEEADKLAVADGRVAALQLDGGGDGHGDGREDEADADALEVGDAGRVAGDAACEGDEDEVVDGDEYGHEDDGDDGDGGGRDLEGAEVEVHDVALLHREGLKLGEAGVHEYGAGQDGEHADDDL